MIKLKILEERAMQVIRYLEHVGDIEIVLEEPSSASANDTRNSWAGAIENPSRELLDYANKIRGEWEQCS